jgi:protein required for attachment to host cells
MKPTITWIVVADGGRARIFEHRGPGKGLMPVPGLSFEDAHLRTQDINADRAGRTHSAQGRGSAMDPPTDAAKQRELAFIETIAALLKTRLADGAFTRLIIAADPAALGNLRAALGPALDRTIVAEVPKNLTKVPLAELGPHFDKLLVV